jgi:hypothetical protein
MVVSFEAPAAGCARDHHMLMMRLLRSNADPELQRSCAVTASSMKLIVVRTTAAGSYHTAHGSYQAHRLPQQLSPASIAFCRRTS